MSLNEILEWQAILALRGYLIFTLSSFGDGGGGFTAGTGSVLDEDAILNENARNAFEYELTRVFTRPHLLSSTIDSAHLEHFRLKLAELLVLLDTLAWTAPVQKHGDRFQHIFSNNTTSYDQIWYLLDHLEDTKSPFNLIRGPFGPAFSLPSDHDLARHLRTVEDVNALLDSLPSYSTNRSITSPPTKKPEIVVSGVRDNAVRQYASATFNTVFNRLGRCATSHTAMLYLRSQHAEGDTLESRPLLDLLISSCPKHTVWREIQCCCPTLKVQAQFVARNVTDLCTLIKEKKQQCITLHATGKELRNVTQGAPRARHGRDTPSCSLHALISRDVFKPLNLNNVVSDRFSRAEKRSLAQDIVRAFSYLLGSEWVGKGWCSKNLFFLKEKLDQTRSNTPFGPYVTCSNEGPPLEDLDRWAPHLDDPPILLFLAKLLLEIDLGTDLNGRIEAALDGDEEETLHLLLLDIYEEYKWDLDYGDAIDACLRYHVERQLKLDEGEISEVPGQWSEWDRRYVRGVVKKLEDHATEALQPSKDVHNQGWWTPNWSHPGSETPGPAFWLRSDPGNPASALGGSLFEPSQTSSTARTSLDERVPTPEPQGTRPEHNSKLEAEIVLKPTPVQTQIPLIISGWLDAADESVADPEDPDNPLDSRPKSLTDVDEQGVGVLFDTTEDYTLHDHQKGKAKQAEEFWGYMREFNKRHFPPLAGISQPAASPKRVKIALIDTGIDVEDPLICPEFASGRIWGRSWVGDELDLTDTWGHGTHLARLVLRTSKSAEVLIAKVAEDKSFTPKNRQNIVEAIHWAIEQDTDIISLSLGFKTPYKDIETALREAIHPKSRTAGARPRLIFAAAANWGFNRGLAFPASMKGVICVHATSGNGYDGQINPGASSDHHHQNFPVGTLGITIESLWRGNRVWLKGTSYSTPIAAATAANLLDLARRRLGNSSALESYRGMKAVMALMCADNHSGSYPYFAPWLVYEKHVDMYSRERIETTEQLWEAIEDRIDSLHYN